MRALLIPVGDDWYALPVGDVWMVLSQPRLTRVPDAPPAVLGLTNVRGEVIPVLDTGTLLGLGALQAWSSAAITRTPAGRAGLTASAEPVVETLTEVLGPSPLPCGRDRYRAAVGPVTAIDLPAALARLRE